MSHHVPASEFVKACHYVLPPSRATIEMLRELGYELSPIERPSDEAILEVLNIAKDMTIGTAKRTSNH